MNLCTCFNCGGVFDDTNPQTDAEEFPEIMELRSLEDHSCPVCLTDEHLMDGIMEGALSEESKEILSKHIQLKND